MVAPISGGWLFRFLLLSPEQQSVARNVSLRSVRFDSACRWETSFESEDAKSDENDGWQETRRIMVLTTESLAKAGVVQAGELALAREALRAKDPVICSLIDANPNFDPHAWRELIPVEGLFEALLYQIVGQQISVSVADVIHARLLELFPGGHPDPETLAQTSVDTLRGIGLSTRKAEYITELAQRAADGEIDGLADMAHGEARERLVSFRGIGPWTADGALLIAFRLPDVLVSGDLVLRKAVQRAYGLPALPSEKEVEAIGERWRPHRTLAAGYLFESMVPA